MKLRAILPRRLCLIISTAPGAASDKALMDLRVGSEWGRRSEPQSAGQIKGHGHVVLLCVVAAHFYLTWQIPAWFYSTQRSVGERPLLFEVQWAGIGT